MEIPVAEFFSHPWLHCMDRTKGFINGGTIVWTDEDDVRNILYSVQKASYTRRPQPYDYTAVAQVKRNST